MSRVPERPRCHTNRVLACSPIKVREATVDASRGNKFVSVSIVKGAGHLVHDLNSLPLALAHDTFFLF